MQSHHKVNKNDLENNESHQIFIVAFFIWQLFFISSSLAVEQLSINLEKIDSKDWLISGASLTLQDIGKSQQKLALTIDRLQLPEPFSIINIVDVKCLQFSWQQNNINCHKGRARLKSKFISHSVFSFSFAITDKQTHFNINGLQLAGGSVSLQAKEQGDAWVASIQSKKLQLKKIYSFLKTRVKGIDELSEGFLDSEIQSSGNRFELNRFSSKTRFHKVSLQANKGQIATESLNFKINLLARLKQGIWYWDNKSTIESGELYIKPIYLKLEKEEFGLQANGQMNRKGDLNITGFSANHADVFQLKADGNVKVKSDFTFDHGLISIDINDLGDFSTLYMAPFFEQTALDGVELKGRLKSEVNVEQSKLIQVVAELSDFTVLDNKQRISIGNAQGQINWSINQNHEKPSVVSWEKLKIKLIPVESGQLNFLFTDNNIKLLRPASIKMLEGVLNVKQFSWYRATTNEPKVFFEGGVIDLSLEQLSEAFGWTSLSGKISGYIPGVDYQNKTLKVNGELKVDVFGGVIKINKLASSGLFTDFAKFYMDMELDNLDLYSITQKFKVGAMEGRISGFVNNLYLENWQPVTFHAWLGTPDNDESRHRISQKAVENIASIGGGGAADLVSKGVLRFFDTFNYDSLGFGCYLHQGVCQLMGVEAKEKGYYIVKGGGLPRIDVIGYNTRLDWKVLVQRLSRVFKSDEIIIK